MIYIWALQASSTGILACGAESRMPPVPIPAPPPPPPPPPPVPPIPLAQPGFKPDLNAVTEAHKCALSCSSNSFRMFSVSLL